MLIPALGVVVGAFVLIRVAGGPVLSPVLDNVHWTTAYLTAAILAWMGVRSASPEAMAPRRWFAWGLTLSAIGQLVWDVQTSIDWNPFPAPSTVFYICLGPACAMGMWSTVRAHAAKIQLRTVALDAAALVVALLAFTLALYLPKRGNIEALPLNVLVAYPVGLFSAAAIGVVALLSLRLKPDRRLALMPLSLVGSGLVWLQWNSLSMEGNVPDGTWLNLGFSAVMLLMGIGAMTWHTEISDNARWERFCEGALRLLPLLLVVLAAASVMLALVLPGIPGVARISIDLGAVVVLVLAVVRQSMLLTERDRLLDAEQRMRESEGRFKILFETAQDAIFIMTDREFIDCNHSTQQLFGCSRDEIIGHSPVGFSPPLQPDQRPSADKAREKIIAAMSGKPQFFEWRHQRPNGTVFDAEVSLNRFELDGRLLLQAIVRDISPRKQAERELRWRTALFEAQVDATLDGILVVDQTGKKIIQNQRMAAVWRIPPEIALEADDSKQVDFVVARTKNPGAFAEKVAYLYAHPEEISRDEIELVDETVLDRYTAPVRDQAGNHYGRIWTFRDITEQRNLESQLRQSQKMEAIGQLAGGVAHDFNNMLTVIKGHIGMMRVSGQITPDITEPLQQIEGAADRAAKLTIQLLTFSRQQVMQSVELDLNVLVSNLTKMLRRLLSASIAMEVQLAARPLMISADEGMVEQVLLNFVVNARDAMPRGGTLQVTLEAVELDEPAARLMEQARAGSFVRLAVRDTGSGIAPEVLPRIFEPFFTTKEIGKGTGLGLATVYGVMQQHNGWARVESEVGRGSVFSVYFPRVVGPEATKPAAHARAPGQGGDEGILLVEDEPSVRLVAASALNSLGYRVFTASSGLAALQVWATHRAEIELLLTDLVMPDGVNGRELALRLLAAKPRLPVVYMSGYSHEVAGDDFRLEQGANYLPKPFDLASLAKIVRDNLDRRVSAAPMVHPGQ